MDGRFRRNFKGTPKHVKIGYGSNTKTRFLMPDGFHKVYGVLLSICLRLHGKESTAADLK
jgi:ribosomal protein L32E